MARRSVVLLAVALASVTAISLALLKRGPQPEPTPEAATVADAEVRAACGTCHAFPDPEILPADTWRRVIEQMAYLSTYLRESIYATGFAIDEMATWYELRAPQQLPVEMRLTREEPSPVRFRRRFIGLGSDSGPGIATVERLAANLLSGASPMLTAPNMANGSIHLFSMAQGPRRIGEAGHPVRAIAGDFDGDGRDDLVISDLGNPMPTDELVGRVLVARHTADGDFAFETILEQVGRIADARPMDLDGDGDLDIVAASFGMLRSGGIYVLRNETARGGALDFRVEKISERPGAVSVMPFEELRDGSRHGFAAAFAQHYEMISVFYPVPSGYDEHVIFRAPHPNWGVSNARAVDFDGDADTDFLLAHGDTLDDGIAFKFYHGVEWLENRGGGRFLEHPIGTLYGAHSVEATDLDGDGDLDVVACGFLPQVQLPVPKGRMRVDSVVWFERTDAEWIPWSIEFNHPRHTGMTVIDLNEDGLPDIVAGINRAWDLKDREYGPSLEVWFNQGPL